MQITFHAATLVDDTASPPIRGVIAQLGQYGAVQTEQLYGAANEVDFPRGNVGGLFVFTAACSYASYDAATTTIKTASGLVDVQDTVLVTPTGSSIVTLTLASAVLKQVDKDEWIGKFLRLRYTFKITTIT